MTSSATNPASLSMQPPATTTSVLHPRLTPSHVLVKGDCAAEHPMWNDLDLQLMHATCGRTPGNVEFLQLANEKVTLPPGTSFRKFWAYQKQHHGYDALASIIASSSYAKKEDFIRCGYSSFHCQDTRLCPLCCYQRLSQRLVEEFGNTFAADREVFFIVASVSSDPDETRRLTFQNGSSTDIHQIKAPGLAEPRSPAHYGVPFETTPDLLQCRLVWSFIAEAIHELTGTGRGACFSGVVGGPELAVRFQPLSVLPHSNFLAWSPGFSADDARKLRKSIRQKMRDCRRLKPGLYPTIACYRLGSADDLRAVASYMCKSIDLASAYEAAADLANYAPAHMIALNAQTNTFLHRLPLVCHRLPRIVRYGACNASSRSYFGQVTEWRLLDRARNAEWRRDRQEVYDVFDQPGYRPYRSVLEKWEQHIQHRMRNHVLALHSRFYYWNLKYETPRPPPPRIPISTDTGQLGMKVAAPRDGAHIVHVDILPSEHPTAPIGAQPLATASC